LIELIEFIGLTGGQKLGGREAGRPGGMEAGRPGGWEAGTLGSWEAGRPGSWEADCVYCSVKSAALVFYENI